MTDKIQEGIERTIEDARRSLTQRQRRFVREYVADPTNATVAAVRAGYSPKSARTIASRLLSNPNIQSELAQHFVDQEKEVSEALVATLMRLRTIVQKGSDDKFLKASKVLLEYTRLAAGVLGLQVKPKAADAFEDVVPASLEDLIEQHREEIARLELLRDSGLAANAAPTGTSQVS